MDVVDPVRVVLAFTVVTGLLALFAFALKKFGKQGKVFYGKNDEARIGVLETCYIDNRRKLLLVKRDDATHLLLISPEGATVIESNIPNKP
jgi:flagellar protein FliO/FliZ